MALRDLLNDRMNVEAPEVPTKDASAGPVQSWVATATNVPCQVNELSAGQRVYASMAGMAVSHEILTLQEGISQGYRLKLLDTNSYVRVTGVQRVREQGGIGTYYAVTGEEVRDVP